MLLQVGEALVSRLRPIPAAVEIRVSSLAGVLAAESPALFLEPHGVRHPCSWPAGPYRSGHDGGGPSTRERTGNDVVIGLRYSRRVQEAYARAWYQGAA